MRGGALKGGLRGRAVYRENTNAPKNNARSSCPEFAAQGDTIGRKFSESSQKGDGLFPPSNEGSPASTPRSGFSTKAVDVYSKNVSSVPGPRTFRQFSSNFQTLSAIEKFLGKDITTTPETHQDAALRLREEFEASLKYFEAVPRALKDIPKQNPHGIYANHNLRLDKIKVYGFDYDYTLAHYTEKLQALIYDLAKERLVKEQRYPEACLTFTYDHGFPIRGLYYDKRKGYLLKLDFFHSAEFSCCFYGRRRMSRAEVESAYGGKHIGKNEHMKDLMPLMDLFCLSEACLISDVIQLMVDEKLEFDPAYVFDDVNRCINWVHMSGLLHQTILANPQNYLVKNEALKMFLKRLKEYGKKLFILTNSPFAFVDGGMKYLFQEEEATGTSWRETFDVVIALSDKPNFYMSERPFRHYDIETDKLGFKRVESFEPHKVYYHGNVKTFLELTKWKASECIYFGDHLFSDLKGPAKAGWKTGAIIRELERDINIQNEDQYRIQQAKYHMLQELLKQFHSLPESRERGEDEKALLDALRQERRQARIAMVQMFNSYFGSTFLTDTGKESAFAYNVQRYADFYTSRLDNLLSYTTESWLCSPFDVKILPHHVKVPPPHVFD